jgi:NCS2 family nucleobase:cation symporter-2
MDNIYTLDGKVPLLKSIPFGLQHVLAMFVANIAPIMIVTGASGLSVKETASLIQTAMIIAGIGTLVQLFSVIYISANSLYYKSFSATWHTLNFFMNIFFYFIIEPYNMFYLKF